MRRRTVLRTYTKHASWSRLHSRVCWRYPRPVSLVSLARSPYGTVTQGRRPPHRTAAAMSCDCTGRPEMGGWGRTPEVAPIVAIRATAAYLWWTGDPYSSRIRTEYVSVVFVCLLLYNIEMMSCLLAYLAWTTFSNFIS